MDVHNIFRNFNLQSNDVKNYNKSDVKLRNKCIYYDCIWIKINMKAVRMPWF